MKKNNFWVMATLVLSLGLNGCGKEDPAAELNVDRNKVATVSGIAHATLDGISIVKQYAPQGTKVFLKVEYTELSSGASTGVYLLETTVGASGKFEFQNVPVSNNGATVTITGDEFVHSYTMPNPSLEFPNGTKNEMRKYHTSSVYASINVGSTAFVTLEYGTGSLFE
ncbi:MAG: hypothetical protein LBS09_06830 [Bacteroidales bacterium]|jgi:hypothetical protein|nr:hypothetical protein [Bacteroidales bacterium]